MYVHKERGGSLYKLAICYNIPTDLEKIMELVKMKAIENNINGIQYYRYQNGEDLLQHIDERFDVIFLGIDMQKKDRLEIAKAIRKRDSNVILVFCSGVCRLTPDMFKLQPYRFITKQVIKRNTEQDIQDVLLKMSNNKNEYIITIKNGHMNKIYVNEIIYITLRKRGCEIFLYNQSVQEVERVLCEKSLKEIYEILNNDKFVFAHNSYVINIDYLTSFNKKEVLLHDNICLTVARSKEKFLSKCIVEYFDAKIRHNITKNAKCLKK